MHSSYGIAALGWASLLNAAAAFHVSVPVLAAVRQRNMRISTTALNAGADGDLKKLVLKDGECEAELYTLGGCVTSFKVKDYDYLFVRPDAKLDGSKPISGGLPHCFPQFGPGEIQQHGFARNFEWDVAESSDNSATLTLSNNEKTMAIWPHPFECTYKVALSGVLLETELVITNTGESNFDFQAALHSYFRCSNIDKVTISCPQLNGASYLNKMKDPPVTETFSGDKITISTETDQVFKGVSGDVVIDDAGNSRKLTVNNLAGWADTVVWNPYGSEAYPPDISAEGDSGIPTTAQRVTACLPVAHQTVESNGGGQVRLRRKC